MKFLSFTFSVTVYSRFIFSNEANKYLFAWSFSISIVLFITPCVMFEKYIFRQNGCAKYTFQKALNSKYNTICIMSLCGSYNNVNLHCFILTFTCWTQVVHTCYSALCYLRNTCHYWEYVHYSLLLMVNFYGYIC